MGRVARAVGPWLVSAAIFLLTGEMLSRAFRIVDRMNGFPRQLFQATDDPHMPYVMRPGVDVTVRGIRVRVNALGLRGPDVTTAPADGVRRVLAVGDSATFGEGVPIEEAWPSVLERDLVAGGGRWEVVNAGVEGWNTEAELAWLRQRGLALAPRVVVVGFNLNDFDGAPVIGPQGVLTLDRAQRVSRWSPLAWSEFAMVLRWLLAPGAHVWIGDPTAPPSTTLPEPQPFNSLDRYISVLRKQYYKQPNDDRWPTLVASLRGLGDIQRQGGPPIVVVILPDGDQFDGPAPDLNPQRQVLALCAAFGLECLDLHAAFQAAGGRTLFRDIMHPNAEGYRLVSREIAPRVRALADGAR